jgi:hypothetical protein
MPKKSKHSTSKIIKNQGGASPCDPLVRFSLVMQKLGLVSVSVSIGLSVWPSNLLAADMPMPTEQPPQSGQFQRIEQPLMLKIAVTAGGMALIGGQLWWFLGKPKS